MLTWGGKSIPCGCESRKDIMFTQGNVSPLHFAIGVGATIIILVTAWKHGRHSIATP